MSAPRLQAFIKAKKSRLNLSKLVLIGLLLTALVILRNERNDLTSLRGLDVVTLNAQVPHAASSPPGATVIEQRRVSDEDTSNSPNSVDDRASTTIPQPHTEPLHNTESLPIIDFISIGSIHKAEWQATQLRTFASHRSVRRYFRINEHNDTDATCFTNFTELQLAKVIAHCNNTDETIQSFDSMLMRKRLFWPKRHTGWLCAQKRPIDGLYLALQSYTHDSSLPLPSFLIIMDDDTYVNMDKMIATTLAKYDIDESHVIAGCRYTYPRKIQFAFPYGGFGTFLTRAAIARLLEPIYCSDADDRLRSPFGPWACWRLEQNVLGERTVFRPGMSLGRLMYEYAAALPFTAVEDWAPNLGFCLHSDHALGYFFNYYHLGVPDSVLTTSQFSDKIRMDHSYEFLAGGQECANEKNSCLPEHRLCHYIRPDRMEELYANQGTT